ncbi:MAG: dockerin type I domain-containing protein [Gammaproteobacteria bacterium]|nr:dockerin type I domain-containing protein [Gammaproteobacteria bacterium]
MAAVKAREPPRYTGVIQPCTNQGADRNDATLCFVEIRLLGLNLAADFRVLTDLVPEFSLTERNYTAMVEPLSVYLIEVTSSHSESRVSINGKMGRFRGRSSAELRGNPWLSAEETMTVMVTSANGTKEETYTFTMRTRTRTTGLSTTGGNGGFHAAWSEPQHGEAALSYQLRWKKAGAAEFHVGDTAIFGASARAAHITGLDNCHQYEVQLARQIGNGTPDYAESSYVAVSDFHLDVDGNNAATATDGIRVARHILGAPAGTTAAKIQCGIEAMALDVDADGDVDSTDGVLVSRYLLGLRGTTLTDGFDGTEASTVGENIEALLP